MNFNFLKLLNYWISFSVLNSSYIFADQVLINITLFVSKIVELSNPQNVSMSDDWYELTEPNHFWIKWRFEILKRQLIPFLTKESRILEIGCGNGVVMKQFEDYLGRPIEGCDLNRFAINNLVDDFSGTVYLYDIYDLNPSLIDQFDIILLLDVIEHIDDEKEFIDNALKHLKKDGLLIVNVPVHQWLFSKFDRVVGHKRRYNIMELKSTFKKSKLDLLKINYWGLSFIPLVILRKLYLFFKSEKVVIKNGFHPPHGLFNKLMLKIMKFELKLFSNPISGTSAIAIGKKTD